MKNNFLSLATFQLEVAVNVLHSYVVGPFKLSMGLVYLISLSSQ